MMPSEVNVRLMKDPAFEAVSVCDCWPSCSPSEKGSANVQASVQMENVKMPDRGALRRPMRPFNFSISCTFSRQTAKLGSLSLSHDQWISLTADLVQDMPIFILLCNFD
jgi:hypothetical protein